MRLLRSCSSVVSTTAVFFLFHPLFSNGSLRDGPTLVGTEECSPMPNIRLPLYWSGEYSPDRKSHNGPEKVTSIIPTDEWSDEELVELYADTYIDDHVADSTVDNGALKGFFSKADTGRVVIGQEGHDGTTWASLREVALGSRVVVVLFAYADDMQCAVMAKEFASVVEEVNEAYAKETDRGRGGSAYDNDAPSSKKSAAFVVINNFWPLQCDQKHTKCHKSHKFLTYDHWQGQLLERSPQIPLLQDVFALNTWDTSFGAYYGDAMVFLDGKLYRYLPSPQAFAHSEELRKDLRFFEKGVGGVAKSMSLAEDVEELKLVLIEALNHFDGQWCGAAPMIEDPMRDATGIYEPSSTTSSSSFSSSLSSAAEMLPPPPEFIKKHVKKSSLAYDVLLGFTFAALIVLCMVGGCSLHSCIQKCTDTYFADEGRPKGNDGRGMFQMLGQIDEDERENDSTNSSNSDSNTDEEYGAEHAVMKEYGVSKTDDDDSDVDDEEFFVSSRTEEDMDQSARNFFDDDDDDDDEEKNNPALASPVFGPNSTTGGGPKPPRSAYDLYLEEERTKTTKEHPPPIPPPASSSNADRAAAYKKKLLQYRKNVFSNFTQKCAQQWEKMEGETKGMYEALAQVELERFTREMELYTGKQQKGGMNEKEDTKQHSTSFFNVKNEGQDGNEVKQQSDKKGAKATTEVELTPLTPSKGKSDNKSNDKGNSSGGRKEAKEEAGKPESTSKEKSDSSPDIVLLSAAGKPMGPSSKSSTTTSINPISMTQSKSAAQTQTEAQRQTTTQAARPTPKQWYHFYYQELIPTIQDEHRGTLTAQEMKAIMSKKKEELSEEEKLRYVKMARAEGDKWRKEKKKMDSSKND